MIYINLPDLYDYTEKLDTVLTFLTRDLSNQHLFITPITFVSQNLQIPYCYMGSHFNNHKGPLVNCEDLFLKANYSRSQPFRIDLANIFIGQKDQDNTYFNIILDSFNNGSNQIEVCNANLINYIKQYYPNYSLVFSANANLINPLNKEIINIILNDDLFDLVQLPGNFTDIDFLNQLSNRHKIELPINSLCKNCNSIDQCFSNEQEKIYNFSKTSHIESCPKLLSYDNLNNVIIPLDDIINNYTKIGINHYSLCPLPNNKRAILDFLAFIVDYFIKPEYRFDTYKRLEREVI